METVKRWKMRRGYRERAGGEACNKWGSGGTRRGKRDKEIGTKHRKGQKGKVEMKKMGRKGGGAKGEGGVAFQCCVRARGSNTTPRSQHH